MLHNKYVYTDNDGKPIIRIRQLSKGWTIEVLRYNLFWVKIKSKKIKVPWYKFKKVVIFNTLRDAEKYLIHKGVLSYE